MKTQLIKRAMHKVTYRTGEVKDDLLQLLDTRTTREETGLRHFTMAKGARLARLGWGLSASAPRGSMRPRPSLGNSHPRHPPPPSTDDDHYSLGTRYLQYCTVVVSHLTMVVAVTTNTALLFMNLI